MVTWCTATGCRFASKPVFGPEQNSRVAVRLVEASGEVRASLGWGRGVEKAIKVENLQAFHAYGCTKQRLCDGTGLQRHRA